MILETTTLIITIIVGNVLYYFSAICKKVGNISIEEFNESDLVVSDAGELQEILPDKIVTEREGKIVNRIGQILFLILASIVWVMMGVTAGRIAVLFRPSDFHKIVVYFLIYFFFLRIPFGIMNRTIEKSYQIKIMPEKLIISVFMIVSYIIGINRFDLVPEILKYQLLLIR